MGRLSGCSEWDEFCSGVMNEIQFHSPLYDLIKKHTDGIVSATCFEASNGSKVVIHIEKIKCTPLEEIENVPVWMPSRSEDIKKWADNDALLSAKVHKTLYIEDEEQDEYDPCRSRIIDDELPRFSRLTDLDTGKVDMYKISDGIHRTARARDLGISCIMAQVAEEFIMSKEKFFDLSKNKLR